MALGNSQIFFSLVYFISFFFLRMHFWCNLSRRIHSCRCLGARGPSAKCLTNLMRSLFTRLHRRRCISRKERVEWMERRFSGSVPAVLSWQGEFAGRLCDLLDSAQPRQKRHKIVVPFVQAASEKLSFFLSFLPLSLFSVYIYRRSDAGAAGYRDDCSACEARRAFVHVHLEELVLPENPPSEVYNVPHFAVYPRKREKNKREKERGLLKLERGTGDLVPRVSSVFYVRTLFSSFCTKWFKSHEQDDETWQIAKLPHAGLFHFLCSQATFSRSRNSIVKEI